MTVNVTTVLRRPIVTEKTVAQSDKYTFEVHNDATKGDVKKAVKMFYGVDVKNVNMGRVAPKTRMMNKGKSIQKRKLLKKATITLEKGTNFDFNSFK